MKKILTLLMGMFMLVSCGTKETLGGKVFRLLNTESGAEITLLFDKVENRYAGKAVNNYFGSYQAEGEKISFAPAGMTMMMGPQPMMDAEKKYFEQLAKVSEYKLQNGKLQLITSDGKILEFEEIEDKE